MKKEKEVNFFNPAFEIDDTKVKWIKTKNNKKNHEIYVQKHNIKL